MEKHPLGEVFIAPLDVFLNNVNIYQPNVIFVSSRRRNIITEKGIEGAPDLVVEILSPGTARFNKGFKRKVYARTGVKELWMVDPDSKTIQTYLLAQDAETPATTHNLRSFVTSALLPGLRLSVAAIFKSSPKR